MNTPKTMNDIKTQTPGSATDALIVAFVQGAQWWEHHKTGATMWASDRDAAEAAARARALDGTLGESPVGSSALVGQCMEAGDDDAGQPRLIIHTTREQLMGFGRNLVFADVTVTLVPPNNKVSDAPDSAAPNRRQSNE